MIGPQIAAIDDLFFGTSLSFDKLMCVVCSLMFRSQLGCADSGFSHLQIRVGSSSQLQGPRRSPRPALVRLSHASDMPKTPTDTNVFKL